MSSNNNIIRVNKNRENPYVMIQKGIFEDERLSWDARGLMGYLLSKPDGWQVRFWDLVNRGNAKQHAMQRMLKELEEAGYMYRYRTKDAKGRFQWITEIYEMPELNPHIAPLGENQVMEKPLGDYPLMGNPSMDGPLTDDPSMGHPSMDYRPIYQVRSTVSTECSNNDVVNTESVNTEHSGAVAGSFASSSVNNLVCEEARTHDIASRVEIGEMHQNDEGTPRSEETSEPVHWSTENQTFEREAVKQLALEMTELFEFRNAETYIATLNDKELIHLLLWMQYCDRNYEQLSTEFEGNIKSIPGYIRKSVAYAPTKVSVYDKQDIITQIRKRERHTIRY